MKYIADLDTNNYCQTIKKVNDDYIKSTNNIELPFYDESILNKKYKSGTEFYPHLTILSDKKQINSDGIDTANITTDFGEYFIINDGNKITGSSIQFSSNVPGKYLIESYSQNYGNESIIIEVI